MNQSDQNSVCGKAPVNESSQSGQISGKAVGMDNFQAGDDADRRLVLTDQERAQIVRRASKGLVRLIAAQAAIALVVILGSWLVAGNAAALSALIGAAAYFVPNALFAMRLLLGYFGPAKSGPFMFFAGEAFKLGTAVVVLALAAWYGRDWLVWPALLLGLIGVLKGYVLLLLFRKLP